MEESEVKGEVKRNDVMAPKVALKWHSRWHPRYPR